LDLLGKSYREQKREEEEMRVFEWDRAAFCVSDFVVMETRGQVSTVT
jgi:hypothetical protein